MGVNLIKRYRITSVTSPAPDTKIFRMEPAEGSILIFKPGQFVFLHILDKDGRPIAKRPYSIASSPLSKHLEFCIKIRKGEVTSKLDAMAPGSVIGIEGPFGNFAYDGQQEAGFIAGGVGIAPFMGMLRYIADTGLKGKFVLFYSAKSKDSLLYQEELAKLRKKNPGIKVVITLTRESPAGWDGECGHLDQGMIMKHADAPEKMSWWICGPLEMVSAVRTCLVKSGKDPKDIKAEGWG